MLNRLIAYMRGLTRRRQIGRELEEEMRFHLEQEAEARVQQGLSPAEAKRIAQRDFGGVTQTREAVRDARAPWPLMEAWLRDCRYAARGLRKTPTFLIMSVATLALTIGANTAIYTVVDRVLLRPLPYPEADRLGTVARRIERDGGESASDSQSGALWFALREHASLVDVAAMSGDTTSVNFVAGNQAVLVQQQRVSEGFFRVLGVPPMLGREFTAAEDRTNGPPVAVLNHGLWIRMFNGDPAIIGRRMTLRGELHTIVGVMPATFQSNVPVDVWTPLRPSTRGEGAGQNYTVIARLQSGATWGAADGQVASIGAEALAAALKGESLPAGVRIRTELVPLQIERTAALRRPLIILWGAVGTVLLIGCVNIAGLLLARTAVRAPEIAMRVALGASRAAIVRHLLAESLILAICGGVSGVALGDVILRAAGSQLEALFGSPIALDGRVLLISGAASLLTSVLFGLFPALQSSRTEVRPVLGASGGTTGASAASHWPRRLLVVTQVSLCIVLVVCSGLLVRTLRHLTTLEPGFDGTNVLTATVSLQDARYETSERVTQLFDRTVDGIEQIPGVERAAVALTLPYERAMNQGFRFVGGEAQQEVINLTYVTPEYFDALRVRVARGRVFTPADNKTSVPVTIVNQAFSRRYSPTQDPVGRQLSFGTIVGVVEDIQQRAGAWGGYEPVAPIPAAYVPAAQVSDGGFTLAHTWFSPSWIVRTASPQQGLPQLIEHAVHAVDPQLPVKAFRTLDNVRAEAVAGQRVQAMLLGFLATLAVLLATVGIYGLVASGVAERTREIGIRVALGATPMQTVRAAALPAMCLAAVGVAIGLMLARGAAGLMRNLVYGVEVTDSVTFLLAAVLVIVATGTAALVPSVRILRLNVIAALRRT